MFDVVVVGADDSQTARRAVEAACEICAMSKGTLRSVPNSVAHGAACSVLIVDTTE